MIGMQEPSWLPRLYALTDDRREESHVEQARILAASGARLIQIRAKRAEGRELYAIVVGALEAIRGTGALLIVNDRVDVAVAAGADGVHVGQDDLPVWASREIIGPSRILGVSTHTLQQASEANSSPVDYIAYGPVFSTGSKENPDPVVGLAGVAEARKIIEKPLVAIGGITLDRSRSVLQAGADSIAVISDLWTGDAAPGERLALYMRSVETSS
jgi:thiamine-phosphate pyrophosphorylase